MPNVRHNIMWCSQVWREMNPQMEWISWRMSKILRVDGIADFAMDEFRMKEIANELACLISCLNIGSEEMSIEEYVQWVGEDIVEQSISWLSWWNQYGVEKSIWV